MHLAKVAGRMDSYFVFSLSEEWRRRPAESRGLEEPLDTPFARAEERERAWLHHAVWLQRQVDKPMFDEAFSLLQVYVPLRTA